MARLALFISVDKERKLENEKRMPPPSRTYSNSNPSPVSNQSSPPSSHTFSRSSSRSSQTEQLDPFTMALQDWETLQSDFRTWKIAIMAIKSIRVESNMPTPFGPAIIYNDIRIAAAEMLYLAAQIHLTRAHPSTPSFPPAAIGSCAPTNGPLVAEVMRIQEGLWDTANFQHVGTEEDGRAVAGAGRTVDFVVSALSNSAWPMLVAGVQVKDEKQRIWMKKRLCDIYELSGFATAVSPRNPDTLQLLTCGVDARA
jgi:hypothetical protein